MLVDKEMKPKPFLKKGKRKSLSKIKAELWQSVLEFFIRRRQFFTYVDKKCSKDPWIHFRRRWLWSKKEVIYAKAQKKIAQ